MVANEIVYMAILWYMNVYESVGIYMSLHEGIYENI